MARVTMTIEQMLADIPMGGVVTVYAPLLQVLEEVGKINSRRSGVWIDVATAIADKGLNLLVISKREAWDIASEDHLLNTQRFYNKYGWLSA